MGMDIYGLKPKVKGKRPASRPLAEALIDLLMGYEKKRK
jgi:hypothetical protein